MKKYSLLLLMLGIAGLSHAEVRTEHNLPLALANQLASQAVAVCQEKGFAVSATVVDRAGQTKAVQRADNFDGPLDRTPGNGLGRHHDIGRFALHGGAGRPGLFLPAATADTRQKNQDG